jgi:non-heme chloroperoxidase
VASTILVTPRPAFQSTEDDQIVPVKDSAKKSARLIKGAKGIYYPGAPHGLTATHQDQVNRDLLVFLRS